MWPKFPDIYLVEGKPRKTLNQEIDSTGDQTRARCVSSNYVTPSAGCSLLGMLTEIVDPVFGDF